MRSGQDDASAISYSGGGNGDRGRAVYGIQRRTAGILETESLHDVGDFSVLSDIVVLGWISIQRFGNPLDNFKVLAHCGVDDSH